MPESAVERNATGRPLEDRLLFWTARMRMSAEVENRIRFAVCENIDWIYLIQLAIQHETMAFLYWNLQRICPESVPSGILGPLAARYKSQAAEAQRRSEELVRILGAFEEQNVFALGYKGPMLSQSLYGDFSIRDFSQSSDLDIIVLERDLPQARSILLNQDYQEECRNNREVKFRHKNGQSLLELQWRFNTPVFRVPDDPARFLRILKTIPLAGASVCSLPLEVYFLVLSLHATKHKWRKLKLVCDIAAILQAPGLDWDYVVREAEDLGIKRTLAVAALLAEDAFEVVSPTGLTNRLGLDRAARRLAAECREEWLKPPDERWREHADLRFLFKMRERPNDRLDLFLWEWLWPDDMPDRADRRFVPIPDPFSALYYLVRPVRLAWQEITGRS